MKKSKASKFMRGCKVKVIEQGTLLTGLTGVIKYANSENQFAEVLVGGYLHWFNFWDLRLVEDKV